MSTPRRTGRLDPVILMPTAVRLRAAARRTNDSLFRRAAAEEWVVHAYWRYKGIELAPQAARTGVPSTDPLDVIVRPPPGCHDVRAVYLTPTGTVAPGSVWSPVLIVSPDDHDPSNLHYSYDYPSIEFGRA